MKTLLSECKRIVVKVGSSLVTNQGAGLDLAALSNWSRQIVALCEQGHEVVLVSSGAIAEGMQRLGWTERPILVHDLQAAAAVGQMGVVQAYEQCFSKRDRHAAQILLTHEDLVDRERYLNARSTVVALLSLGVIPIINENDSVVTKGIKFGDNDTLAALVTNLIVADALIILTDQIGLYTADPRSNPDAKFVSQAEAGDPLLEEMAGGAGSHVGTGGMITKIVAAKRAARSGAHTVIASGHEPDALLRLMQGESIGTLLVSPLSSLAARKQWLADHVQLAGQLVLDSGAVKALVDEGTSLLPVGVIAVEGDFERGSVVACICEDGTDIAHGLVNYSSEEARQIIGQSSHEIPAILGYGGDSELIHRDNLVLL